MKSHVWNEKASLMALVMVAAGVSGCVGGSATTDANGRNLSAAPTVPIGEGAIHGRVVDDELVPVPNSTITIEGTGITSTSNEVGAFRVEDVPPGNHSILVEHAAYESLRQSVSVLPDDNLELEFRLRLLPSFVSRNLTHIFTGHYDCGHEIPIWTGDCMILYEAFTGQNDSLTAEDFQFRFPVEAQWDSFVMELVWEYAANNQLDGMRFYLEHVTNSSTDHGVKVGRVDGKENPLRFIVHRGEPHPRADVNETTQEPATFPVEGALAQVRVFPKGYLYDEMCTVSRATTGDCYLGWGAGIDIRFTVYATVFYNGRASEDFTAIQ